MADHPPANSKLPASFAPSDTWLEDMLVNFIPIAAYVQAPKSKVKIRIGTVNVKAPITDAHTFARDIETELRRAYKASGILEDLLPYATVPPQEVSIQIPRIDVISESASAAGVADDIMRRIREELAERHCRLHSGWQPGLAAAGKADAVTQWNSLTGAETPPAVPYWCGLSTAPYAPPGVQPFASRIHGREQGSATPRYGYYEPPEPIASHEPLPPEKSGITKVDIVGRLQRAVLGETDDRSLDEQLFSILNSGELKGEAFLALSDHTIYKKISDRLDEKGYRRIIALGQSLQELTKYPWQPLAARGQMMLEDYGRACLLLGQGQDDEYLEAFHALMEEISALVSPSFTSRFSSIEEMGAFLESPARCNAEQEERKGQVRALRGIIFKRKNISTGRNNIVIDGKADISIPNTDIDPGHWWIEIYNSETEYIEGTLKESYGWYPFVDKDGDGIQDCSQPVAEGEICRDPVRPSPWQGFRGVQGRLNRGDGPFDPHATQDEIDWDVDDMFHPLVTDGRTHEEVADCIREYAVTHKGEWAWPSLRSDEDHCQTFQEKILRFCGLKRAPVRIGQKE